MRTTKWGMKAALRRLSLIGLAVSLALTLAAPVGAAGANDTARSSSSASESGVAKATSSVWTYRTCGGSQVRRCVWFNYDYANNRVRAYSRITDARGGGNYIVATRSPRLQWWRWPTGWTDITSGGLDADGWWAFRDTARGSLEGACSSATQTYRARAWFQWSPGHGEWFYGDSFRIKNYC